MDTLVQRLRETAFLTRGLRIVITDEREGEVRTSSTTRVEIRDFVEHVNSAKEPIHKRIVFFEGEMENGPSRSRCNGTGRTWSWSSSFANINTTEGGAHLSGFKARFDRNLNKCPRQGASEGERGEPRGEDVREGLAGVISVKLREPQFEWQTKTKLGNRGPRPRRADGQPAPGRVPGGNPTDAKQIVTKGSPRNARQAARRAQAESEERARELLAAGTACRLSDQRPRGRRALPGRGQFGRRVRRRGPQPRQPGDSPLRGKVINSEKNRINKVLSNLEIQSIITAIGTGSATSSTSRSCGTTA